MRISLIVLVLLACAPALAQPALLIRPSPIAPRSQASPRLRAGTPAATAINQAMAKLDADYRAFLKDCTPPGKPADARRLVLTPMTGPDFLTVDVREDYSCYQTAHPDVSHRVYVYDLRSGSLIDWSRLLAGIAELAYADDPDLSPAERIAVRSRPLQSFYHKQLHYSAIRACRAAFRDPQTPFMVWPDAKAGGLEIAPFDPPHAIAACAQTVTIPAPQLMRMGADPRLVRALARR